MCADQWPVLPTSRVARSTRVALGVASGFLGACLPDTGARIIELVVVHVQKDLVRSYQRTCMIQFVPIKIWTMMRHPILEKMSSFMKNLRSSSEAMGTFGTFLLLYLIRLMVLIRDAANREG